MSEYYNINGLKVRVSDHEPNEKLHGASDIELYTIDVCGTVISIESQIKSICEKRGLNVSDFDVIASDFRDGSYDATFFKPKKNDDSDDSDCGSSDYTEINALRAAISDRNIKALAGHSLPSSASHAEIKKLSELTGVSQAFIKKYFGIRW